MSADNVAPIDRIFTPEVIATLDEIRRPDPSPWDDAGGVFRKRPVVLRTREPAPGSLWAAARRRAWADYLDAAERCGLLNDVELRANLIGTDDDSFRGAIAECMAAWFLSERLGMGVEPKPVGRSKKMLDMRATTDRHEVFVEVKAPFVPRLYDHVAGDDAHELYRVVEAAGRQFKSDKPNLLFVASVLRTPIGMDRWQLVKAVIGEPALAVPISPDGSRAPPPYETFLQRGKLARLHPRPDGSTTTHLTRISAVIAVEPYLRDDEEGNVYVDHYALVVHNPFAAVPIPAELFGKMPQLVHGDHEMYWTDKQRW